MRLGADPFELVVLAGQVYRTFLWRTAWKCQVPMEGLGIGEQLSWLNVQLGQGSPSA